MELEESKVSEEVYYYIDLIGVISNKKDFNLFLKCSLSAYYFLIDSFLFFLSLFLIIGFFHDLSGVVPMLNALGVVGFSLYIY